MHKLFRSVVGILLVAGSASLAAAGDLKLTLDNGRVTLIATNVPLRQILDEWARIGKTTIVNGDKLMGPPLTLQLVDRPEREVLDVLLRSASGYIVAQRVINLAGASQFDKVMILPVSRGPVGVASATPPPNQFGRPPTMMQQQVPMPVVDDDEPVEPPQMQPGPNNPNIPNPNNPNGLNPNNQGLPNMPGMQSPAGQPVLTAPRPGMMLPAPPTGQPNPYGPPGQVPPFVRPPGGPGGGPGGA
jgi:hypothetical protein